MIFDSVSMIAMHLTEVVRVRAHQFIGLAETNALLSRLENQLLVKHVVPARVSLLELRNLLRQLVRERVSVRDLELILETLADRTPDEGPGAMLARVRVALRRATCNQYTNNEGEISVIAFEEDFESLLEANWAAHKSSIKPLLESAIQCFEERGLQPIVLTPPSLRWRVRCLLPDRIVVLSTEEIAPGVASRVITAFIRSGSALSS